MSIGSSAIKEEPLFHLVLDKPELELALGQPVAGRFSTLRCADGKLAGCRAALAASLRAAVDQLGADPSTWNANPSQDDIRFTAVGIITIPNMSWQNRPTFQQVVQVTQ